MKPIVTVIMLASTVACATEDSDAVMPEIGDVEIEVDDGELSELEIEVMLVAPDFGPSIVAIERVSLFADPPDDATEPLLELAADFELGFDRVVVSAERRDARVIDAGTSVDRLASLCGGSYFLHMCVWSAKPESPLVAGCGWRDDVEIRCR